MTAKGGYAYGRFRRSYKRDGRHGWGWMVTTAGPMGGAVVKVDTEAEAKALTDALNEGRVDRNDAASMRRILAESVQG